MQSSKFIGRGEERVKDLLHRLFQTPRILQQVPIKAIIGYQDWVDLGPEYNQHKFDIVIFRDNNKHIVIEVNYRHGEGAAKKWSNVYKPLLKKYGHTPVTIDDWDCRKKGLFHETKKGHINSWNDFRDVIDALEKAGVKP